MIIGRRVLIALLCCGWISGGAHEARAQAAPAGQEKPACGADLMKSLSGNWKAPEYKMKRASEVGTQVFGPNAFDIRNVDLTLEPSGEGVLKISTSVLDQKGKTWAPTLIEAKVMVAALQPGNQASNGSRCSLVVTVTSVEERYLDDTKYQTALTGSRVMIVADPTGKQLEVRFEPPKGEGSFWSTLNRQAAGAQRTQRARPVQ